MILTLRSVHVNAIDRWSERTGQYPGERQLWNGAQALLLWKLKHEMFQPFSKRRDLF
ncbi:MAG: hypothetical protein HOP22_08740 [Nitrospiraceae bacterium]|nr:hypothetical protein [Nitrospiraceae bacterium]